MKISSYAVVIAVVMFFLATPVLAGEGYKKMDHGKTAGHYETMKDHMLMMHDNMMMTKELMGIIKDLSHIPTKAQKKRLTEMMNSLDKMMGKAMKMHDEMKPSKMMHK